jgi:hypothetical protein
MDYQDFLARKAQIGTFDGFYPVWMPDFLREYGSWQADGGKKEGQMRNEKPEDSLSIIARYWTTYLSKKPMFTTQGWMTIPDIAIEAEDVAAMMSLFKVGRRTAKKEALNGPG